METDHVPRTLLPRPSGHPRHALSNRLTSRPWERGLCCACHPDPPRNCFFWLSFLGGLLLRVEVPGKSPVAEVSWNVCRKPISRDMVISLTTGPERWGCPDLERLLIFVV